jgi:nucleoside triphosphate pyrophosphatase
MSKPAEQTNPRLILASQSQRRKELLDKMGLAGKYDVIPSGYEELLDNNRSPQEVAEELGYGKALWVAERNPGAWVIGSDTIVTVNGKQLAKAADEQEARTMLKLLSGQTADVTTSVALVCREDDTPEGERVIKHFVGHESCQIAIKPYDSAAIEEYLALDGWRDKAGSFGIQSGGHKLADYFTGNYDTVLGLPTHVLSAYLNEVGIQSKPVELQAPIPRK